MDPHGPSDGPTQTHTWTHWDLQHSHSLDPTQPRSRLCTSLWSRTCIALHSVCIATAQHCTAPAQHCIAMHGHKSTDLAQAPEPPQQHQALQSLRTKDSEGPDEAQETAMEPNRRSWNILECCRMSWNIMECHGTLWNLMESYGKLWKVMESYGIV